ncbi:MAG: NAD(P)H-dependent oxidoreductase [Clostridia bacterium]|nr:NAD(P)H-dependent oxidoreductase [Clostridia bacterium]
MSKALIAYFSCTGTTAKVASALAEASGADLYAIKPEVPYTLQDLDWNDKNSRSTMEMDDRTSRPALADCDANVEAYDTILLGFPVWWGRAPSIINTFLEAYDFTGKTVYAFCTSGGGGVREAEKDFYMTYPKINWQRGENLNGKFTADEVRGFAENCGIC